MKTKLTLVIILCTATLLGGCTDEIELNELEQMIGECNKNGGVSFVNPYFDTDGTLLRYHVKCKDGAWFNYVEVKK